MKKKRKINFKTLRKRELKEKVLNFKNLFNILLLVLLFFVLLGVLYSSFFYYKACETETCFLNYLKDCNRATYYKEGDFSFKYKINGYFGAKCVVDVSLDSINEEIPLRKVYLNSDMGCFMPFSSYYYPDGDLSRCSGLLKEGLQEVLIQRLKTEVVNNLEDINLDILKT